MYIFTTNKNVFLCFIFIHLFNFETFFFSNFLILKDESSILKEIITLNRIVYVCCIIKFKIHFRLGDVFETYYLINI